MPTAMKSGNARHGKDCRSSHRSLLSGLVFFAASVFRPGKGKPVSDAAVASVTADSMSEEPITLEQAIQIALEKNPLRKAALADQKAAAAGVKQAQSLLLAAHRVFRERHPR